MVSSRVPFEANLARCAIRNAHSFGFLSNICKVLGTEKGAAILRGSMAMVWIVVRRR